MFPRSDASRRQRPAPAGGSYGRGWFLPIAAAPRRARPAVTLNIPAEAFRVLGAVQERVRGVGVRPSPIQDRVGVGLHAGGIGFPAQDVAVRLPDHLLGLPRTASRVAPRERSI